jgi:hypothetical protein
VYLSDAKYGWEARLRSAALLSSDTKSQSSLFQAMLDDQSGFYVYLKFRWILVSYYIGAKLRICSHCREKAQQLH